MIRFSISMSTRVCGICCTLAILLIGVGTGSVAQQPLPDDTLAVFTAHQREVLTQLAALRKLPDATWQMHPGDLPHGEDTSLDTSDWTIAKLPPAVVASQAVRRPQFQLLQNSRSSGAPVIFFAFDILVVGGRDVRRLPLNERQRLLRNSVRTSDLVQVSETFHLPAKQMIALVEEHGLEGVVAKRLNSRYESARRSGAWQKLCLTHVEEFVVGGFVPGANGVDALLIGFYRGRKLQFCASVRAGFVPASRRELYARLAALVTDRCPFTNLPERSPGRWGQGLTAEKMLSCIWVKPKVVARCTYQEWTVAEHLRRVSYVGVCEDKDASEVVRTT